MGIDSRDLAKTFGDECGAELSAAWSKIEHCLEQLDDDQLWWRPAESANSIANLMLHLTGNVRQWIVSGVGGARNDRRRQAEFDERGPLPRDQLRALLGDVVSEARAVLADMTPEELLRPRTVQGYRVTGMGAVVESVSHFRGHAQEIVHLTRAQLGDRYRFDFVPTAEQQGETE